MGILTDDMKRVVREVGLGFHATVSGDGSPNLSPKGTTASGTMTTSSSPISDHRRPLRMYVAGHSSR